ncbi:MAG: hypothetical protein AB7O38_16215 [Pirellulaceae bacterium]
MSSPMTESKLRESLMRFETCVQTPIISGELTSWLQDAQTACAEVRACVQQEAEGPHAEMLRKMKQQDPEMGSRVEQLREEERELQDQSARLQVKLDQLIERARAVEPDELKLDQPIEEFIEASLAFVLAARKHDTAMTTWHNEAFNRDRGVLD